MKKMDAIDVYNLFQKYLKKRGMQFAESEEDGEYGILLAWEGEDLSIPTKYIIEDDPKCIFAISPLPFSFSEDRRIEGAIATSIINYESRDGSFDYNIKTGNVCFRLCTCWEGCIVGEGLFKYLIDYVPGRVDEFNDKLLMVSTGIMSIEQFYQFVQSKE